MPFGTVLEVPGYGVVKCEDRGGAIRGRRLDVLMPTHAEARAWGVKQLTVTTAGTGNGEQGTGKDE
jgi:3D (Asp-Asp-Asp) domain-containing protein